uniref:SANT domain-containing protein n=1 Tax=Hemiselmis andersenii TaxID=464988 RepID=A0A7S1MVW1_HEMAN
MDWSKKRRTRSHQDDDDYLDEYGEELEDRFRMGHTEVPDMLITEDARQAQMFRSFNGVIIDPVEDERDRGLSNIWSEEEKQVFVEKFVDFASRPEREGVKKNFYAISHYLPNKSTRDCVSFYYQNKKTKYFKQLYRRFESKYRKSYGTKNKLYRQNTKSDGGGSGGSDLDFPEVYAFEKYPDATFQATARPGTQKEDKGYESNDSHPEQSYSRKPQQRYQSYGGYR